MLCTRYFQLLYTKRAVGIRQRETSALHSRKLKALAFGVSETIFQTHLKIENAISWWNVIFQFVKRKFRGEM